MENLWSEGDAKAAIAQHAAKGINEDLALRVYTTRLLGGEPRLVLHGGGNTSVKTTMPDITGQQVEVLCVKGSGWDMGTIEAPGLPAVRLDPLRELKGLQALSDEDMVNVQRSNLLDSKSPNPSVETLLHAFLPHKFIDHTHSNAVLSLTDQPDGEALALDVFGKRAALVPYVMPGFALAKKTDEISRANPGVEGLVLLKHGIFSMGATAEEAYVRMIDLVTLAEKRLARETRKIFPGATLPKAIASVADVAPILRGLMSLAAKSGGREASQRFVFEFRTGPEILAFVGGKEIARYSQQGPVTPDHAIRTKGVPLIAPAPEAGKLDMFRTETKAALDKFAADYHAYFARHNGKQVVARKELDPIPRVVLVPGLGLFGLGNSSKDAKIAADLAETTVAVVADAERLGTYECIPEPDIFDIEYWSLEQAKLSAAAEKPLARRIVVVTGGASGIGAATAQAFAREGAEVAVLDRDVAKVKGLGIACDVTDPASVRAAFDKVVTAYGGVDIVVSNAGAAWQGRIGDVDDATLRKSFELNFWAHQSVAQNAVRVMRTQELGGCLLFNTSKQAVNPGPDFGPYGLPKAATLFLMRQYALDHGGDGIRANAVNADRIRTGLLTDEMIAQRSKARGLSEADYMGGNLLGLEVTADDVAQAFVALAKAPKTTGSVTTVDGGNIAAALR
ncbi:MAG: short-chain dehydrogenase [Alphaproteobacteria bacterium RIFCSPHIGHO2_12_FULL_66_14]|jgi:rhamnose utilization protein RhaD (predicted bifunctional aldolase and dehydrogenase)/NAD(P)-dependent dehydrogenase (short-subunit alcohol dehydrogenase family)|nr:MAG: short-chain dehydrogenase [Alphaproteobacteria bacterium RIFCSPHIGHO2_12_FULL_66_14]